jgi:serine/threonine-protein kinase RsbW
MAPHGSGAMSGRAASPGPAPIRRRFTSGDLATRETLIELTEALTEAGLCADDVANAELILAEALNNIVEHAYAGTSGPVDLCVEIRRDGLDCALGDQGREAPLGYPPDPPLPEVDPPFDLPEGGFGWHIIRCLTTDLRYRREGAWNVLSFRMPFSGLD